MMIGIGTPSNHNNTPLPNPMTTSCLRRSNNSLVTKLFRDPVRRQADAGNDDVEMGMMGQRRAPAVQNGGERFGAPVRLAR